MKRHVMQRCCVRCARVFDSPRAGTRRHGVDDGRLRRAADGVNQDRSAALGADACRSLASSAPSSSSGS